jgi:hypothetical protein
MNSRFPAPRPSPPQPRRNNSGNYPVGFGSVGAMRTRLRPVPSALRLSVARFIGLALAGLVVIFGPALHVPAQDERGMADDDGVLSSDALGPVVGGLVPPEPGLEGGTIGYELALSGSEQLLGGRVEQLSGIAYEVAGLDELRRTRGLDVEVSLIARTPRPAPGPRAEEVDEDAIPTGMPFRLVQRANATSGAGGVFTVALSVPDEALDQPMLVIRVGRRGAPHRRWVINASVTSDVVAELLTDRLLYEAGETLHAWARLREGESHRPVAGRTVTLLVSDVSGQILESYEVVTRQSGAIAFDVPLAASLAPGMLTLELRDGTMRVFAGTLAQTSVTVGTRHLERMRLSVGLDRRLLAPGEDLTGMVQVIAADSTPVEGAEVWVSIGETERAFVSDARGQAQFTMPTARYLSGDSQGFGVDVRVSHPAHGSAAGSSSFTLTRTPYFVEAMAEGGALPVEVETDLYVEVKNALGEPAPAGLGVEVVGAAVVGRTGRAVTDTHGLVRIRARVPRTAVARSDGGACSGLFATELSVTIQRADGRPPRDARLCVPVQTEVLVLPRVDRVVVAPGERIEVSLLRGRARTPVLVTLVQGHRPRAFAFADANETRVTFDLPARARGVWEVRVQPLSSDDARGEIDAWGAMLVGTAGITHFIVRPNDAFALDLSTDAPRYPVRGTMTATLATSVAPAERAWATFLVRDESWHAGEVDYAIYSWSEDLRDILLRPTPSDDLFLRHALASMVQVDSEVVGEVPVLSEPWNESRIWERPTSAGAGVLFDPLQNREILIRATYAEYAAVLENVLQSMPEYDEESARQLVVTSRGRTAFASNTFSRLVEQGIAETPPPRGLGGTLLTPADIERANIGFSFEIAAARVARMRLVTLLGVLARVGDTTDPAITRLFAVEPPERWLALAAHHGFVEANLLLDPWGRPFVFRDAGTRRPAIVISDRAPNWELVSAGADGRYGTGDDVRDPFARVVPEGTVYAERSGENALIAELSRIAPGAGALARMAAAYRELGLAAEDERIPSAVFAYASEAYVEGDYAEYTGVGESGGGMGLGLIGTGAGGGGMGYGSGSGSGFGSRSSSVPRVRSASAVPIAASALSRVVREDFPATLFFVGEVALDAQGRATLEVVLADAVTTYRLEAIAWSETGWTSSALARVNVDQTIQIDAPIPERAHVGDRITVPVRIVNRGSTPMRVRPSVTIEGDIHLTLSELSAVVVPPEDGVALSIEIGADEVGSGSIRIEALSDTDERLDAVRRPIEVRPDARPLTLLSEALLEDGDEVSLEVPADALPGGEGEVRIWLARGIFGELADVGDDAALAAWVASIQHLPVGPGAIEALRSRFPDPTAPNIYLGAGQIGALVGGLYATRELDDATCAAFLRYLSDQLAAGAVSEPLGALLGLSAAVRNRAARPSLDALLMEVVAVLRDLAAAEGARATDSPETWARVAAAMAMVGDPEDEARIEEMLRRIERHVIRLARRSGPVSRPEIAWLEPDSDDGTGEPRVAPTALYALALIGRGRPREALPLLRMLAQVRESSSVWPSSHRALAMAAMGLLTQAEGLGGAPSVALTLDGAPLEANSDTRSFVLPEGVLSRPGLHTLRARLPAGIMVFASLRSEHLVPWDREEPATLPIELTWEGEAGARDTRAALVLVVRNRSARVITRPIVDIQLPSGAELDIGARALLTRAGSVSITDDGVRIALSAMRVGGSVRIPLRVRSSLAGSLRGLGVTVRDARGDDGRVAVLPSRAVEIPEAGPEPAFDEPAPSPAPPPVPLPSDPMPRALVESLRGL